MKSFAVTVGLFVLFFAWPIMAVGRLLEIRESELAVQFQPFDPALALGAAVWFGCVAAVLAANRPLRRVPFVPASIQNAFRSAVAPALFVGGAANLPTAGPHGLQFVSVEDSDLLEPELHDSGSEVAPPIAREVSPATPAPTSEQPHETQLYTTKRRDTWWSLAQSTLDDGRKWDIVRSLNLGREVSPGVVVQEGTPVVAGWTILVPAVPTVPAVPAAPRRG